MRGTTRSDGRHQTDPIIRSHPIITQPPSIIDAKLQFHLNVLGTYHIDDFSLVSEPLAQGYMQPANVSARIEQHRKGNFRLRFVDGQGRALGANMLRVREREGGGGRKGAGGGRERAGAWGVARLVAVTPSVLH